MSNPTGYLAWLRELAGPDAWIVIEKILAVDEPLEPTLPVAGTTGYDALREIGGLFVDPAGAGPLTALFESSGVAYDEMPQSARRLKAEAVTDTLGSELARLLPDHRRRDGDDHPDLPDAVAALISHVHGVPVRLPVAVRRCCRWRSPKPPRRDRNWPNRWRSSPRR